MRGEPETLCLLLELEDERTRARRRESAFLSVIFHLLVVIFLLVEPYIFSSVKRTLGIGEEDRKPRQQLTYLALPPDNQVVKIKPKTDVLSDKDRLAQPGLEASRPLLPPVPVTPAEADKKLVAQLPAPPQLAPQGEAKVPLPQPGQPAPPLQLGDVRNEQPKLTLPQAGTPGRALEEAVRGVARNRGSGGPAVGDEGFPPGGFNPRSPAAVGDARILSDTLGVDFDPYLRRVVSDIRRNWYAVMPEIARLGKRGRVVVIFEILKDGAVPKLYLVSTSGSEPLDRAALAGISASVPFSPLPDEFRGPFIRLQVTFLYNMFLEQ